MPNNRIVIEEETRPVTLFAIALTGVLASALLGASTNAVNGLVSPRYYVTVLGWYNVSDVWRASIAQGMFEGLCFGVFFSLVFTAGTGVITGVSCRYGFAFKHLVGVLAGAYLCWAIGGLAGIGLAALSPEFYSRMFVGVPQELGARLAYAWVGGSIWGAELGGLVMVILGLVIMRANWRRQRQQSEVTAGLGWSTDETEGPPRRTTAADEGIQVQPRPATDQRTQGPHI